MPTVNFGESLKEIYAGRLKDWQALDENERGVEPKKYTIPELDHVNATWPDEWLMEHEDLYNEGRALAPEGASELKREIYAAINLCEPFEGIEVDDLAKMPLHYRNFFVWLVNQVLPDYFKAMTVPNG